MLIRIGAMRSIFEFMYEYSRWWHRFCYYYKKCQKAVMTNYKRIKFYNFEDAWEILTILSALPTIAVSSETKIKEDLKKIINSDTNSISIGIDNRISYSMSPSIQFYHSNRASQRFIYTWHRWISKSTR